MKDHFTKEKVRVYNETFPCKNCPVFAICKTRKELWCRLLIDWLYYDSYNMHIVNYKKNLFLKLFELSSQDVGESTITKDGNSSSKIQRIFKFNKPLSPWI